VDLPTAEEREKIWNVYLARYELPENSKRPNDQGWTGAEIEKCCKLASKLGKPLTYAAQFVVPVSQSSPARIESLRQQADGKWLSASHPGVYRKDEDSEQVAVAAKSGPRKMDI